MRENPMGGGVSILLIIGAAVALTSIFRHEMGSGVATLGRDDGAIDKAAIRIMVENVDPHVSKYGVANGWTTKSEIDANQRSLEKFKLYVVTVTDSAQRSALEKWIVVEQRSIDEARSELQTGKIRAEDEKRRAKWAAEDVEKNRAMKMFPSVQK